MPYRRRYQGQSQLMIGTVLPMPKSAPEQLRIWLWTWKNSSILVILQLKCSCIGVMQLLNHCWSLVWPSSFSSNLPPPSPESAVEHFAMNRLAGQSSKKNTCMLFCLYHPPIFSNVAQWYTVKVNVNVVKWMKMTSFFTGKAMALMLGYMSLNNIMILFPMLHSGPVQF